MAKARRNRKKQQKNEPEEPQRDDECHNLDVPSCQLVQQVTREVFPEIAGEETVDESNTTTSLLGSLLRQYLVQQGGKKKKRKRKKKKGQAAAAQAPDASAASALQDSLAAAAVPPPQDSSPKESDTVLQHWIDKIMIPTPPTNRELSSFLQQLQPSSSPTISMQEVQEACDSIQCVSCRQSALSFWNSLLQDDENIPILLSTSSIEIPAGHATDQQDLDRAFDYVAMEEGMAQQEQHDQDASSILTLQRQDSSLTCPLSQVKEVDLWMRHLLLPCGLPVTAESTSDISDEQLGQIIHHVQKDEGDLAASLQAWTRQIRTLTQEFESVTVGTSTFDVKTPTILRDLDTACDKLLTNIHGYMMYISVRTSSSSTSTAIDDLWQTLLNTVSSMSQAQQAHEGRLMQLTNRPGVVPQMALNASHRSSYQSLLSTKTSLIKTLVEEMQSVLFDNNLYRRSLCHFYFVKQDMNRFNIKPKLFSLWLEQTHTVHCGNVKDMRKSHESLCKDLLELVLETHDYLEKLKEDIDSNETLRNLESEFTSIQQARDQQEPDDEMEALLKERQNILLLSNNVIFQWKCCLDSAAAGGTNRALPQKLQQWAIHGEVVLQDGGCPGGGGKRRVTSILVALLYKWLSGRCNEWHAELNQKELLEMDDVAAPATKSTKKKGKKKKKVVPLSDETVASQDSAATGHDAQTDKTIEMEKKMPVQQLQQQQPKQEKDSSFEQDRSRAEQYPSTAAAHRKGKDVNAAVDPSNPGEAKKRKSKKSKGRKKDDQGVDGRLDTSSETAVTETSEARDKAEPMATTKRKDESSKVAAPKDTRATKQQPKVAESRADTGPRKGKATDERGRSPSKSDKPDKTMSPGKLKKDKADASSSAQSKPQRKKRDTSVDVGVFSNTGFISAETFLVERLKMALQSEKRDKAALKTRR